MFTRFCLVLQGFEPICEHVNISPYNLKRKKGSSVVRGPGAGATSHDYPYSAKRGERCSHVHKLPKSRYSSGNSTILPVNFCEHCL